MTKFGAAENEMERLTAKFAQRTPTEHSLLGSGECDLYPTVAPALLFPNKRSVLMIVPRCYKLIVPQFPQKKFFIVY